MSYHSTVGDGSPSSTGAPALPTTLPGQASPVPQVQAEPPHGRPVPGSPVVSGLVFDDANGNGVQDAGEGGVPGVPVAIDGSVVAATDAGGRFTVAAIPDARLGVVPPAGWQWAGAPVALDAGDVAIPLRREREPVAAATAVAGGLAGSALLALAVAIAFNSFAALSQAAAVRSLEGAYRRHKQRELDVTLAGELADHLTYVRGRLARESDAWRELLAQLLVDAGVPLQAGQPLAVKDVAGAPAPHFSVVTGDGRLYVFAADPGPFKGWRDRVIAVDSALSLFAPCEVQALWEHLASGRLDDRLALPRDTSWSLVVTRPRPAAIRARRGVMRWMALER